MALLPPKMPHQPPPPSDHPLLAVIFDVDGTLVDSERDGHRVAFNQAFEEFGLPDRWDVPAYGELLWTTGGERRLHRHLSSRGMPEDERNQLVPRLHARKTEIFCAMAAGGLIAPRPGAARLLDDLQATGVRLAVATTGTRAWVHPLLERSFGSGRFEVIVTGDEAPERKPHPSAYLVALERLSLPPRAALAVEDSANGLVAARAAQLPCLVVVNGYTRSHDLEAADLVLDGFGEPSHPAQVLHDPHDVRPSGCLDAITVARVRAATATIESGMPAIPD